MESTSYVLSFRMVFFFYLVTTGWIFDISLLCEISIQFNSIQFSSSSVFHRLKVVVVAYSFEVFDVLKRLLTL